MGQKVNKDITKFLAKQLWRYSSAKPAIAMARLLEFECIRRNYTKHSIHTFIAKTRAYKKDKNSKFGQTLPDIYKKYFQEIEDGNLTFDTNYAPVAEAEGIVMALPEPEKEKEPEPEPEPVIEEPKLAVEEPKNIEPSIGEQLKDIETELTRINELYNQKYTELAEEMEKLRMKSHWLSEARKSQIQWLEDRRNNLYLAQARQMLDIKDQVLLM